MIEKKMNTRLEIINNVLSNLNRKEIIYDPANIVNILTEKYEIEKW